MDQAFAVNYNITVASVSNGSISPNGTVSVASGGSQVFTFAPSAGYAVSSVTVGGIALTGDSLTAVMSSNSYTITNVTADKTFAATFAQIEAAPTLGPLFIGAGKLLTDIGYGTGLLKSKDYNGAAEPDAATRTMYGEIGKTLWLGAMAAASTSNLGNFTIRLSSDPTLNTSGCTVGSTTQAGTYSNKRIAYASVSATGAGSCVVYVTRANYVTGSTGYTSNDSLTWTIEWGTKCADITTETRNDITCHIGQIGPGGGIVFYDAGNAGYGSFQARYLEAAPPGWFGKDQPANLYPLYSGGGAISTIANRPASQGDPIFKICVLANTNLTGSTARNGGSDAVLGGSAGDAGPGISLSYIDQSLRFGSTIGSGPNNDRLYKNSMCAFTPYTPQYELANWKSPSDSQNGLWSVPAYADTIPMVAHSYTLDMDPGGGFYMSSTPCFVDYMLGGNNQKCANDSGRSILLNSKTTFGGSQLQQRISASYSFGSYLGQVPTWNTSGSMKTSTFCQPGSAYYSGPTCDHSINYINANALLRPVRAFPFYSTNAKLSTATGLSVIGGVSGTNYTFNETYNNMTTAYSTSIVTADDTVKIIAQLDDFHSSITIDGIAATDGLPTSVAIPAGSAYSIPVVITALSGDTQTYTIAITRPLAPQTVAVTVSNSPAQVPTGGVVATTLTATGGNGTGAYSFATSTSNCLITGNKLTTTLSTGSCSVTATRLGDTSYLVSSASAAVSFTVTAAGIVPTFSAPVSTASGFTVNVTNYDTGTVFSPTITAGSVSAGSAIGATLPLTITGLSAGQSATVTVTTTKASRTTQSATVTSHSTYTGPTVTAAQSSISYGTTLAPTFTLSGMQGSDTITAVTYSYSGTGSTTYGPSATAPTSVGTYSVTPSAAVFSPLSAAAGYGTVSYSAANFSITGLARTISFNSPPTSLTYNVPVTLDSSPSTGTGTITYTSSNILLCQISGSQVTALAGSGTCTITATVASDGSNASASVTTSNISLVRGSRTLSFTSATKTLAYGETGSVVAAASLGGGTVSYSAGASTACSVGTSSGAITVTSGTGTCEISASIAADSNYAVATTTTSASITISLGAQATFTITSAATKGFVSSYSLTASGGSTTGAITYAVTESGNTASCSVLGAALTTTGAVGTSCVITATRAGNLNYLDVSSAAFTVTIVRSSQAALSITSSTSKAYSSALALTTSGGTGGGLISFAVTTSGSAGCSITGSAGNFSLQSTGAIGSTCGITATSFQSTNYLAINSAQVTITIAASKPTQPLITSVAPGNRSVTVSWTAPSDLGGATRVDLYTVTSTPGGFTCTSTSTSCTVTGLTNGSAYTFKVVAATTAAGSSDPSTESSSITPVTKAAAVTDLIVTTGNTQLTLNWTPVTPTNLGGGTFTSYLVYFKAHTVSTYGLWETITDSSATTSIITGLINGTGYDVKVVTLTVANATEIAGNAAEALQTPAAPPSAPRELTAYSADGLSANVSWQTPISDGGSSITTYNVVVLASSTTLTCTLATPTSTSCTLSSLTKGATLSITVKAANSLMGEGLAATLSYLLPNLPGKPTWGSAVASPTTGTAGTIALNWTAPVNNGNRPITSYSLKTVNRATNSVIATQTVYEPTAVITVSDVSLSFAYFVYATNELGDGDWSESLTATTNLPGSVTFGKVTFSPNLAINVTVANNGGSPITGFLYSTDGINYTLIDSPTSPLSIPNLTPGVSYQIYIKSKNIIGESAPNSITVVVVQGGGAGGGGGGGAGGGGGGGGYSPPDNGGMSAAEIAAALKAAVDKALADKAAVDKALADKAAVDKAAADKAAADKALADKLAVANAASANTASNAAAANAASIKAIADKLAADTSAAAAQFKSVCDLNKGSTIAPPKSSKMNIFSQVCFVPDFLNPLDADLANIKKVVAQIKAKKIKSITLSSFDDEKNGVDFKSIAQTRAEIVSGIIKRLLPKLKIQYRLYGSSTKANSLSLGRVVITA